MNHATETDFNSALQAACEECTGLGYTPTRLYGMLTTMSGISAAKKLIVSGDIQYGLARIIQLGRPDLSIEAIMLQPRFKHLFTPAELSAAHWRLQQAKRT